MSSVTSVPAAIGRSVARTRDHGLHPVGGDLWFAVGAVTLVAGLLLGLSTWAYTSLPPVMVRQAPHALAPGHTWLQAFSWWDGAWYAGIAKRGYGYVPGRQSSVAFFPAYPLAIRGVSRVVGDTVLAGFLLTMACGITAVALFHRWCMEHLGVRRARYALAGLLLYPCSFYLFGTLYADALFLVSLLAAFLLVEHDRPVLAGLAAAVATAARPVGVVVVVGLWALALERQMALAPALAPAGGPGPGPPTPAGGRWRAPFRTLRWRDAGLLLAPAGVVLYLVYLSTRFGSALVFLRAEEGWRQAPGWHTWLKVDWFRQLSRPPVLDPEGLHLVGHALVTVLALALVPLVFRRFGRSYGLYTLAVVLGCAISTNNFIGMGRYLLAAFPIFAVVGDQLARRPVVRYAVLGASAVLLATFAQLHARNVLIS